jgi:hypothetical protein
MVVLPPCCVVKEILTSKTLVLTFLEIYRLSHPRGSKDHREAVPAPLRPVHFPNRRAGKSIHEQSAQSYCFPFEVGVRPDYTARPTSCFGCGGSRFETLQSIPTRRNVRFPAISPTIGRDTKDEEFDLRL